MPRKTREKDASSSSTPKKKNSSNTKRSNSTKRSLKPKTLSLEPNTPGTEAINTPTTPLASSTSQSTQASVVSSTNPQLLAPQHTVNIAPPTVNSIQHTPATAVKEVPKNATYHEEIAKMMYTFGDVRQPLPDSIVLIENYVRMYLLGLVWLSDLSYFLIANCFL
jgi:hypothetical protein